MLENFDFYDPSDANLFIPNVNNHFNPLDVIYASTTVTEFDTKFTKIIKRKPTDLAVG